MVECLVANEKVAGSIPVSRSNNKIRIKMTDRVAEDKEKSGPEPLNKSERKALKSISDQIWKAILNDDKETADHLQKQLADAAGVNIISRKDASSASHSLLSERRARKGRKT